MPSFCELACFFLELEQSHGLEAAASKAHDYAVEADGYIPAPAHVKVHESMMFIYGILDTRYHATV